LRLRIRSTESTPTLAELIADLPGELREEALTHYTWVEDDRDSYKRLAFIGDSVLSLFVVDHLHRRFPNSRPGQLTMIRSRAVSGISCAEVGRELGVPEMVDTLQEPKHGGAVPAPVLLEAARPVGEMLEALIGACYLTFGFERVRPAVLAAFERQIQTGIRAPLDPKSMLNRLVARRGMCVAYEVISKTGPNQAPLFEVAAVVDSEQIGEGEGRSKKAAEHAAAEHALEALSAN
jgi:ribonuclease-3